MSSSMSQASLPDFEIDLNALSAVLDKAEAHAAAKKRAPRCCSVRGRHPTCSRLPVRCRLQQIRPRMARRASPASKPPGGRIAPRHFRSSAAMGMMITTDLQGAK
jgi:hypothetical protein